MTAAITPGPWEVDGFSIKQPGATIAMVWPDKRVSSDDSIARMNANAKAIAAVPAMIEALKEIAEHPGPQADEVAHHKAEVARETLKLAGIEL